MNNVYRVIPPRWWWRYKMQLWMLRLQRLELRLLFETAKRPRLRWIGTTYLNFRWGRDE